MSIKLKPNELLKGIPFVGYIYAALALNVISILAILALKNWLPPVVPLLYGRPGGAGQLTNPYGLIIAPGVSISIIVINCFLSMYTTDAFLKKLLIASASLLSLLTSITVFKIIFLVGFF